MDKELIEELITDLSNYIISLKQIKVFIEHPEELSPSDLAEVRVNYDEAVQIKELLDNL